MVAFKKVLGSFLFTFVQQSVTHKLEAYNKLTCTESVHGMKSIPHFNPLLLLFCTALNFCAQYKIQVSFDAQDSNNGITRTRKFNEEMRYSHQNWIIYIISCSLVRTQNVHFQNSNILSIDMQHIVPCQLVG